MHNSPARPQSIAKVALITDAPSPLGLILARALAQQGWDLALHHEEAQPPVSMLELLKECEKIGRRAHLIYADLNDEKQVKLLIPQIISISGSLACVVNNATHIGMDCATDFSSAALEQHMRVNVATPILLAQALHKATIEGSQAVVINLLDQKLFNPEPDFLSYTLSKAAMYRATESLALALAPRVRVVAIAPALDLSGPTSRSMLMATTLADDFAASICFIAGSTAITGTTLLVNGGSHLRAQPSSQAIIVPPSSAVSPS